jgi:small conductance mechanosensitive channel
VEVEVQVVFGTDLKKVKHFILALLTSDERILKQPPPTVELAELINNTVVLRIYFWVIQIQDDWTYTRSDLILEIDRVFKENEIEMPSLEA